jgi:hypothetical protein
MGQALMKALAEKIYDFMEIVLKIVRVAPTRADEIIDECCGR